MLQRNYSLIDSFLKLCLSSSKPDDKQRINIVKAKTMPDNKSSTSKTVDVATEHGTVQAKRQLKPY